MTGTDGSKCTRDGSGVPVDDSIDPLAPLGGLRNASQDWTVHLCHLERKGTDEERLAQMDQNAPEMGQGCQWMTPLIL